MRLKVLGSAEDALRAMTEQLIEKMNMQVIRLLLVLPMIRQVRMSLYFWILQHLRIREIS